MFICGRSIGMGMRDTVREDETPLAQLGRQLRRAGTPVAAAGPDRRWVLRVGRLRPREREVLRLAAAGLDDVAIAARLGLGPGTVTVYWAASYQLLGLARQAGRREQALALWRAWSAR